MFGRAGAERAPRGPQDDVRNMRDIEQFYNTQIEEMPMNVADLVRPRPSARARARARVPLSHKNWAAAQHASTV